MRERFVETSVLFGVDQLIKGVLGAILGLLQGIAALLPIPGLQNVVGIVRAFLRLAVGLMDEVILGYLHPHALDEPVGRCADRRSCSTRRTTRSCSRTPRG